MSKTYFASPVPSFAPREAYIFDTKESLELYHELSQISEEIETCRANYLA